MASAVESAIPEKLTAISATPKASQTPNPSRFSVRDGFWESLCFPGS